MKKQIIISRVREYVGQHWFKLILLLLIIIACFRKDLKFSLSLNSADKAQKIEQKKNATEVSLPPASSASEGTPLSIIGTFFGSEKKTNEFSEIDEPTKIAFLKRFVQVAVAERKKYNIPSSIILANALRQSYAGKRDITLKSSNHFSLPCTYDWTGATEKNGDECFRKYDNAWLSFRDHSVFITSGKFSDLRSLGATNFKGWAKGLQNLGYPNCGNNFTEELIDIIEKYNLQEVDAL